MRYELTRTPMRNGASSVGVFEKTPGGAVLPIKAWIIRSHESAVRCYRDLAEVLHDKYGVGEDEIIGVLEGAGLSELAAIATMEMLRSNPTHVNDESNNEWDGQQWTRAELD